jgi:hypothetical protein
MGSGGYVALDDLATRAKARDPFMPCVQGHLRLLRGAAVAVLTVHPEGLSRKFYFRFHDPPRQFREFLLHHPERHGSAPSVTDAPGTATRDAEYRFHEDE